ncbi:MULTISPECIES: hypothetical protein [Sphingobacterium]|uniref:hypothetical protein n=1 Tax=Sphingobacterium TaxID=28453 RepID=UPI0013DD31CA|nr:MULTISPECIES: hypothetical protein [unclassified Sphingobacterium]
MKINDITNKQKYLIIKRYINEGKIQENDFLKGFMNQVALQISKLHKLTTKQIDILDKYIHDVACGISEEDGKLIVDLNAEADNIDVKDLLFGDRDERAMQALERIKKQKEEMRKYKEQSITNSLLINNQGELIKKLEQRHNQQNNK